MSDSNDVETFKELVKEMGVDKAKDILTKMSQGVKFPSVNWATNPLALKYILKTVESKGDVSVNELKKGLQGLKLIDEDPNNTNMHGYMKWNRGLWEIKGSTWGLDNKVSLTVIGKEIAKVFNKDYSTLSMVEKIAILGMMINKEVQGFIHVIASNDNEISRKELEQRMIKLYPKKSRGHKGTPGSWAMNYGVTTLKRLGILSSYKKDKETYFRLEVAK